MRPTAAGRKPTIGYYLVALVMLAVVPLMVIAGVLVWRQSELQRLAFERSMVQTAQALSVAVDRQLYADRVMLETLAQSPLIDSGEIRAFYALCMRASQQRGAVFVSLFAPDGRQIFNTLRPMGEALPTPFTDSPPPQADRPPVGDPNSLRQVMETGRPVNSDLFYGLVAQRYIFTMNVPVMREGRLRYVLNAAFEPVVMTQLLHESPQFSGTPAVILDRRGFIVGRSQDAAAFTGRPGASHLLAAIKKADSGIGMGATLQGTPLYYAYARSATTGWTASMGADRRQLERDVRAAWFVGGALALGGLVLGALFALLLAARLRGAIVALANAASRNQPPGRLGMRARELELLERAVVEAAQAREARARREEAEAANLAKDRYIATLSHELRNPLTALANAVHLLRMRADDPGTPDMMQRQIAQLTRMVNDLLDVSRLTHGKVGLQMGPVDFADVLRRAIETMQPVLSAKRLGVTESFPVDPVMVRGDAARLLQVFSNLLDNAAKFTPEGGGIRVALVRNGDDAIATVTDTGAGIDAEFLPQMFEAFTQADTSLERSTSGLGLGLALARQIVEAHGGHIAAASAGRGQGTVVTVVLPLEKRGQSPIAV